MATTAPRRTRHREGGSGARRPDRHHNDQRRRGPPRRQARATSPQWHPLPTANPEQGRRIRWRVDHHRGAGPSKRKDRERSDPPARTLRMVVVEPDLAGRRRPQLPPATAVALEEVRMSRPIPAKMPRRHPPRGCQISGQPLRQRRGVGRAMA